MCACASLFMLAPAHIPTRGSAATNARSASRKCSLMSVYWDRRRLRNVRKLSLLSLLSFPKSTISSKTTKPTFPSRDERIGYRCATEVIEMCYYVPVKNPL